VNTPYPRPQTPTEELVARVASDVLRIDEPSMTAPLGAMLRDKHLLHPLDARLRADFFLRGAAPYATEAKTLATIAESVHDDTQGSALWRMRAGGDGAPIFFLPDVACFFASAFHLAPQIPPAHPLCCVLLPERQRAPYTFNHLEEIARHCAQRILARFPSGPCHLVGYSFGGKLAFQVACELRAAGKDVGVVGILDAQAFPRLPRTLAHVRDAAEFLVWDGAYQLWADITGGRLQRGLRSLGARLKQATLQRMNVELTDEIVRYFEMDRLPAVYQKIVATHVVALERHRERPYAGAVTLIRARRTSLLDAISRDLGWGRVAARVDTYILPGDHWSLLDAATLGDVGTILRAALLESERARSR
jgi:thioesterase domain-containing protein